MICIEIIIYLVKRIFVLIQDFAMCVIYLIFIFYLSIFPSFSDEYITKVSTEETVYEVPSEYIYIWS